MVERIGFRCYLLQLNKIDRNKKFSNKKSRWKILKHKILKYNKKLAFSSMSLAMSDTDSDPDISNPHPEYIPLQYKIVDLPVIQLPPMDTLKIYPCKIYRKIMEDGVTDYAGLGVYEWKRRCYGRIKFIRHEGVTIVAAYEYGSCHIRLKQTPILDPFLYMLKQSQEFPHNWQYQNHNNETISIALRGEDFLEFGARWEEARKKNVEVLGEEWIWVIGDDVFM